MIDLRRIQVLRAVHQHGTVTAAAASLHLTPSAVSHHLRELARELRLPLVEPQGRRIRLTPAAHLVIEHGDALLARWQEAESALESYRTGEAGLLRMCGFPTAASGLLAPAAAALRRTHPDLRVVVTECETVTGFDLLVSTDADIAVVAPTEDSPPPGNARFDQHALLEEPLDLLVPVGHPLTARPEVGLEDAAAESWIIPARGTCDHYQRVIVLCAAAGFTPQIAHHAMEWTTISALVASGFGVSLIPRLAVLPHEDEVVRLPLVGYPAPTRRVLTCVRQGGRGHPLVQHGLRAIEEVIEAHPSLEATPAPVGAS